MRPPALSIERLSKAFAGNPVLSGLNLEVATGSLTAVLGPSGSGKTTLLRLIAGFERAEEGTIRLDGRLVSDTNTHIAPERRSVGFLAQEGALFPHLDVAANVGFGLPRAQRRGARVKEVLDLVGLEEMAKRYPHQLSGGQQQRVALARALAPSPGLILLDEPFDALDAGLRAQVRGEVCDALRKVGATALLVTHDQEEALALADVVAVMRGGAIVQASEPRSLYRDPADAEVASFVGEAILLEGVLAGDFAETALGRLPVRGASELADGPVTLMLRPEQVLCREPGATDRPLGRVISTEFYGHDATARIALEDRACEEIVARAAGHRLPLVGERVSIAIEGTALVYSAVIHPPADWGTKLPDWPAGNHDLREPGRSPIRH